MTDLLFQGFDGAITAESDDPLPLSPSSVIIKDSGGGLIRFHEVEGERHRMNISSFALFRRLRLSPVAIIVTPLLRVVCALLPIVYMVCWPLITLSGVLLATM